MSSKLTGRYKYRFKKSWFGDELVILQLEISCTDFDPLEGHNDTFVFWRDARRGDLTTNTVINWIEYVPA